MPDRPGFVAEDQAEHSRAAPVPVSGPAVADKLSVGNGGALVVEEFRCGSLACIEPQLVYVSAEDELAASNGPKGILVRHGRGLARHDLGSGIVGVAAVVVKLPFHGGPRPRRGPRLCGVGVGKPVLPHEVVHEKAAPEPGVVLGLEVGGKGLRNGRDGRQPVAFFSELPRRVLIQDEVPG